MIIANQSLRPYNTFGIAAQARYFASFSSIEALQTLLYESKQVQGLPLLVLGGGSNILLTQDFPGLVLRNQLKGISVIEEDQDYWHIKAMAGEVWHELVLYCIEHGYAGLENLSLIPGLVGASPMQNIGAYGVEIKDLFHSLEAWHIGDRSLQVFTARDCAFGYRESVFKRALKGQFIILSVRFRLPKKPVYHTSYGAIAAELERMGVQEPDCKSIANAVIRIRQSKLPDPAVMGNAGSFFKNPVVDATLYQQLQLSYPTIPGFAIDAGSYKVPAAWLIEQCGWKGYRKGDAGCHALQPLVLVNHGHASGKAIWDLSEDILQSVLSKFGIQLEREVNIL
ncbi:MAG: UDP-N-acetylmuramate dehydrogenase [Chitinophagaceae bacterium]|nr:UDP-N-acetylmuramate dehydrogenase [Chitinophagaceae bacterium]